MKLIMAVSVDGFVARDELDDMSWTSSTDKKIFRILTSVGGICAVGSKTYATMPQILTGRSLLKLSRNGLTLRFLTSINTSIWLLGGQTIALEAFKLGYIHEVHLCRSTVILGRGIFEQLSQYLVSPQITTSIFDTTVEVYKGDGIRTKPMDMV